MTCTLAVTIGVEKEHGDPGHSNTFDVDVTFEEALSKLVPVTGPSSSLESRQMCVWPLVDGGQLFIPPTHVAWIQELVDDA